MLPLSIDCILDFSLRHYFSKTTWWQQCHSLLRSSQSERQNELDFKDDLRSSVRAEDVWLDTDKRPQTLQNYIETRQNQGTSQIENNQHKQTSILCSTAAPIQSHMNATLAKSFPAQDCEWVNYYRCSIITNHNLLGGPCVIYVSMLKLMSCIFLSMCRCIPSQWNPSLIYLYIILYYSNPKTIY